MLSYGQLHSSFRNEEGGVDLASIMTGIIVIGLIGGVIAATVFAVIPWAQDNAAKQQLDSIAAAQSAYMGLTSTSPLSIQGSPSLHQPNSYGDSAQLADSKLLSEAPTYCVTTTNEGKGYQAYSKSNSGQVFTITESTPPTLLTGITNTYIDSLPSNCAVVFNDIDLPFENDWMVMTYSSPTDTTIQLPIRGGSGQVIWSDEPDTPISYGSSTVLSKNLEAGRTYTVKVQGTFNSIDYRDRAGASALIGVNHWGSDTGTVNAAYAFHNAVNLTDVPAKVPATITDMRQMFSGATSFNDKNVEQWDVSQVKTLTHMFKDTPFNGELSGWTLDNAANAAFILNNQWSIPGAEYTALNTTTTLTYRCEETSTIQLPIRDTTSNITITWNDGVIDQAPAGSYVQPASGTNIPTYTRELVKDRTYTVAVEGKYNLFSSATVSGNNTETIAGHNCLRSLDYWGNETGVTSANRGFYGVSTDFTVPTKSIPSTITNMRSLFSNTKNFNHDISGWDISKVTDMSWMFSATEAFNQDIGDWDTSNVTQARYIFANATSFNQDISKWDTSKITNMERMFVGATSFNKNISAWDVSRVTNMDSMFQSATSFNQNLSSWNVAKVQTALNFRMHSAMSASQSPFGV